MSPAAVIAEAWVMGAVCNVVFATIARIWPTPLTKPFRYPYWGAILWPIYLVFMLVPILRYVLHEIRFRMAVRRANREITELLIQARSRRAGE